MEMAFKNEDMVNAAGKVWGKKSDPAKKGRKKSIKGEA